MDGNLIVSASPHTRGDETTRGIMIDVVIALVPAGIIGIYYFGLRCLLHMAISVSFCVFFEWAYQKLLKKTVTVGDFSAVVTGILLSYNISVLAPLWITIVGAFFAIVVVKQLYGGIGKNFVNPALAARAFLFSFPAAMTTWVAPFVAADWSNPFANLFSPDVVTSATPLVALKAGTLPGESIFELFLGMRGGCIGETSALLLLVGGLYLVYRKVITPVTPVVYIGTVAFMTFFFGKIPFSLDYTLSNILSGGLFLGAIFMATDYTTSPTTAKGQAVFALGCGLLTVLIRRFGGYPEGVSYSILLMNLLVWTIDKVMRPKKFGKAVR